MVGFSRTLVLLGSLAPLGGHALGIGEILPQSALNQHLSAEIPLVLSGDDDLQNIRIRLASPDSFAKAGVAWAGYLSLLQFQPVALSDGRHIIRVTSREPLNDPFLDFIIQIETPKGSLVREFTLLLDPPSDALTAYSGYQPPPRSVRPEPRPPPEEVPLVRPIIENPSPVSTVPRETPAPDSSSLLPAPLTGERYGPVSRGENLASIVETLPRPDSVSAQQMAAGLYLANPGAFGRNIDALLAGSTLNIPTEEYLRAIDPARIKAIRMGYRPLPPLMPEAARNGYSPSVEQAPRAPGSISDITEQSLTLLKRENQALRTQLAKLELRLEEAQQMLTLKEAALEALHRYQQEALTPPDEQVTGNERLESGEPRLTGQPAAPLVEVETQAAAPPPQVKPVEQPPSIKPKAVEPAVDRSAPIETESGLELREYLAAVALILLLAAWAYQRRRAVSEESESEAEAEARPSLGHRWLAHIAARLKKSDDSTSGKREMARGSTLMERFTRRFRAPPGEFEPHESRQPEEEAKPFLIDMEVAPAYASDYAEPTILDPLSEIDVYLRYSRYTQAENLIQSCIARSPEREDYRLKLLEILAKSGKSDLLNETIEQLAKDPQLTLTEGFWASVERICPEYNQTTREAASPEASLSSPLEESPRASMAEELPPEILEVDTRSIEEQVRAFEADYGSTNGAVPEEDSSDEISQDERDEVDSTLPHSQVIALPQEPLTREAASDATATPETQEPSLEADPAEINGEVEERFEEEAALSDSPDLARQPEPMVREAVSNATPSPGTDEPPYLIEFERVEPPLEPPKRVPDESHSLENLIEFETIPIDSDDSGVTERTATAASPIDDQIEERETERRYSENQEHDELATPFGQLDFQIDLLDPDPEMLEETASSLQQNPTRPEETTQEIDDPDFEAWLSLAESSIEFDQKEAARERLIEIVARGNRDQKARAEKLLNRMGRVQLTLVHPLPKTATR